MEVKCRSFPPIVSAACRVIVLGSMPGVASLRAQQYYAHPRNAFWPILGALWGVNVADATYEARVALALSHRIAIWDVAEACEREGSSDSAMRNSTINDFAGFFAAYPEIHSIFFNGRQAMTLFARLAGDAAGDRRRVLLPSTSPAHVIPFQEKLAAWRTLRSYLDQGGK